MTEDEAQTRWCPFARAPLVTATGEIAIGACVVNRRASGGPDAASLCIASACMAWRVSTVLRSDNHVHGYCGLAGASE